jgi:signal transduction histidine kinase
MKTSIRVRFTLTFIGITALAISACIFMNFYFLEDYYLSYKQKIVIKEIEEINKVINNSSDVDEEMADLLLQIRETYNISSLIIGNDGTIKYSSSANSKDLSNRFLMYLFEDSDTVGDFSQKVLYENEMYKITLTKDGRRNSDSMDCWGFLDDDGSYFILSTPIESIRDSVEVSNKFYTIIGAIVIVLSAIYMFFASRHMTKPILELASISEKMAGLDFKAKYTGNSKDEIGILGESMNHLSEQLENTITELQIANAKLTKDIEEKIQIDDMRKEFLSNVSHELKTPIALIQGYAEGLHDFINEDPESREFYCEVIMDEASKMNQMVQKLLSLNHLEFGSNALDKMPFSMKEMIDSVISSVDIMVKQKECSIHFTPVDELMLVYGDEFQLEEVVRNYISNALNHVDDKEDSRKVIEVKTEIVPSNPNKYCIRVFNSGSFIPEEDLEKVWIKFYKVDKARTREYGGSGIGLSIVKAIMDLHDCAYGVRNVDDGVEFWMEVDRYFPEKVEE